jgi:histidinol-phosphate aminotransferase
MRERQVLVGRAFPPMLGYNRVSLGLPAEMEEFARVLRDFRNRGWV